eukprot:FR735990.1.p1 GENE.FR735990.1~~FR735990.1.p1  ORF type:complete len:173 (-),score=30.99 FR735990.1:180-698(-)
MLPAGMLWGIVSGDNFTQETGMTRITPSAHLTLNKGNKSWSSTAVAAALELVGSPWLWTLADTHCGRRLFFFFLFFIFFFFFDDGSIRCSLLQNNALHFPIFVRLAFSASPFLASSETQSILCIFGSCGQGHRSSFGHCFGLNASISNTIGRVKVSKQIGISFAFSFRKVLV